MNTPELVTRDTATCLSVTGRGEPGGSEHLTAIAALQAVATAMNATTGPLEGRWWTEHPSLAPLQVPREQWRWQLLLELPAVPRPGALEEAVERARHAGPAAQRVQVTTYTEGRCVQLLHEGPYSDEPVSLKVMDDFMAEHRLRPSGLHHEVYLTAFDDPRPRTLLRQPVTGP